MVDSLLIKSDSILDEIVKLEDSLTQSPDSLLDCTYILSKSLGIEDVSRNHLKPSHLYQLFGSLYSLFVKPPQSHDELASSSVRFEVFG